jgi:TonB family protein
MGRKTFKLIVAFLIILLCVASILPLDVQQRRAKRKTASNKVVAQKSEENSQKVRDECVPTEDVDECLSHLEAERPTATECFSAIDLICPSCKRGKVLNAPQPCYPKVAKAARVSGEVVIEIVIDESGKVIWARVVRGHPLLQASSLKAACRRTFEPYTCSGRAVKAVEILRYNFALS